VITSVNVPVILELKVTLPQQYGPEQLFDITNDVTCIGEDDVGGGEEDAEVKHTLPMNTCDFDGGAVDNGSPIVGVTGTVY